MDLQHTHIRNPYIHTYIYLSSVLYIICLVIKGIFVANISIVGEDKKYMYEIYRSYDIGLHMYVRTYVHM